MIPWLLSSPDSKNAARSRATSCSCDIIVGGKTHLTILRDFTLEIPSLNAKIPLSLPQSVAPLLIRQQNIAILNRYQDDLVYLWVCCNQTNTASLVAFKITSSGSAALSPKSKRFSKSMHSPISDAASEDSTSAMQLYSFQLPGALQSIDILDSQHGRASFVAFHCTNGKEILTASLDMRLVLRYTEKVSPTFDLRILNWTINTFYRFGDEKEIAKFLPCMEGYFGSEFRIEPRVLMS